MMELKVQVVSGWKYTFLSCGSLSCFQGATINELESWLSEYESLKEQLGQSIAHEETLLQKSNEVRMEKKKVAPVSL